MTRLAPNLSNQSGEQWLKLFQQTVRVRYGNSRLRDLVRCNYGAFTDSESTVPHLEYIAEHNEQGFCLQRPTADHSATWSTLSEGEFLFLLEKDLTIELQKRRPDLYFLHAAALEYRARGVLLIAPSGSGKSTSCWGLLQRQCRYLSDEMAPIDLSSMQILPYPHALCLKTEPPAGFPLPAATLRTEATLHIPTRALSSDVSHQPTPVHALVFVQHLGPQQRPEMVPVSAAQATAWIYANALNPLSHPRDGLDAALAIAAHGHSFKLITGELAASVQLLLQTLDKL